MLKIALIFLGDKFPRVADFTRNYANASNRKVPNLYPAAQLNGATPNE
jgi:hypothetical protein